MNWLNAHEANGRGLITDCGNYAIRECVYHDGTPTDYWCYYKLGTKFMRMYAGVKSSLELAKDRVERFKINPEEENYHEDIF